MMDSNPPDPDAVKGSSQNLNSSSRNVITEIAKQAHVIDSTAKSFDFLLSMIGDSRLVLLGEASHGTHEFYKMRADITMRLIRERGFNAVAVEADWPEAYRVNRYVRGASSDSSAFEALSSFKHFPAWMWRNTVVFEFIMRLYEHNHNLPKGMPRAGFYGLDLYSLHASIEAVLNYLEQVDPAAAKRARSRYSCFEHFGQDPQSYGYAATMDIDKSCEDEAVRQLIDLQNSLPGYVQRDGRLPEDEHFFAEQNARLVRDAEAYYRSMFQEETSSWNLRDRHMASVLEALTEYLDRPGFPAKIVVWAHNSHLGDARATDMSKRGELNLGQLARERFGSQVYTVGFSTYDGSVTAASDWGGPAEVKRVRPGLPGSYEELFHESGIPSFLLDLRGKVRTSLSDRRLERAIGVIYRPQSERISHYFYTQLPQQFDAVIHIDRTCAVEPLERTAEWEVGEQPETFPTGV